MKKKKSVKSSKKYHGYTAGDPALDAMIRQLMEKAGGSPNQDLLAEIIVTALRLREDELDRGDVKLINSAMKELRYAFKVFYPYRHVRKVALFGSARTPRQSPAYHQAREFARLIVQAGWMVITGASAGIMNAGNEGAGRANSFGVNIRLPFEQMANPVIADDHKLINFKYFFTRKLIFIAESDATVLCPGGFGTHDEGFETLTLMQTGKTNPRPVVCLDPKGSGYWKSWKEFLKNHLMKEHMIDPQDMELVHFTHDPSEAVEVITKFYKNYHSMRYIDDRLVFRIKKPLTEHQMESLNEQFSDIMKKGKIRQYLKPFEEEENQPYTLDLARLAFYFNRRNFARLNQLIHAVNKF